MSVRRTLHNACVLALRGLTTTAEFRDAARAAVLAALEDGATSTVEMAGHASATPSWGELGLNFEAIVLAARELAQEGVIGRGCGDPSCANCGGAADELAPS